MIKQLIATKKGIPDEKSGTFSLFGLCLSKSDRLHLSSKIKVLLNLTLTFSNISPYSRPPHDRPKDRLKLKYNRNSDTLLLFLH